ncbi:MAG TPA: hypothetical protein VIM71_06400 [Lacunisphaera sp.]
MTWTWAELFSRALVRSGLLGRGQIAGADLYTEARDETDLMLDEWDGQGVALPAVETTIQFNTVSNQALYYLGEGSQTEAFGVRPESIITATCTITTNPDVNAQMVEMDFREYTIIPVPSTSGVPWNYAVNPTWPQMQLYLYPTPAQVYPVTFNCKVKWRDTLGGDPTLNPFQVAEVNSGYASAIVDNLALRLAQKYRLETSTLENRAYASRYTMAMQVAQQQRDMTQKIPRGIFSNNILVSGVNP